MVRAGPLWAVIAWLVATSGLSEAAQSPALLSLMLVGAHGHSTYLSHIKAGCDLLVILPHD